MTGPIYTFWSDSNNGICSQLYHFLLSNEYRSIIEWCKVVDDNDMYTSDHVPIVFCVKWNIPRYHTKSRLIYNGPTLSMVRCGAGLNIEVCGAVRAPALDDGVVRVCASSLGAVRSRAKLLGPRRALLHTSKVAISLINYHGSTLLTNLFN